MKSTKWLFWTVLAATVVLIFSLFCFTQLAKRYPLNYLTLLMFTLGTSYLLAGICIFQSPTNVVIAAAMTLTVFFSLSVFTFFVSFAHSIITVQTKYELNLLTGLLTIVFHLLILLIPLLIVFNSNWIFIIVCLAIILLISIFLIYDTQVSSIIFFSNSIDDCQQPQVWTEL